MTPPALRPYLPTDAEAIADIFRASIFELAADDYSEAQLAAWAEAADDEAGFATRLANQLTLVAMLEGEPVGFGSLAGNEKIDLLYVHPDAGRLGVATALVDAFEKLVAARGATKLGVDASENATAFFAARNYTPLARNTVLTGDEWLANTSMQKILAAAKKV